MVVYKLARAGINNASCIIIMHVTRTAGQTGHTE